MLVSRNQLIPYDIADDLFFARRTGEGSPISRNQFFITNPARLAPGLYCAIGNDEDGWELEQYNGVNWAIVQPDPSYSLVITNEGLAALTNVARGGIQLYFSGIKIINNTVLHPNIPLINWTDTNLLQAGEVVFSVGTIGSPNLKDDTTGDSLLPHVLKWRFNSTSGGLQYIVELPPEGLGAISDNGKEEWNIGAIGLYVKDPSNNTSDILFGIASLPSVVKKYSTTVDRVGNTIKLYFNTVLTNLGFVSNLQVMSEGEQNIPEVPNESLLLYPNDPRKRPYNCYVVDSLYGTGIPALAVPRNANITVTETQNGELQYAYNQDIDWAFFQPTDNFINADPSQFTNRVSNYMFVYWNATLEKYDLAEGKTYEEQGNNALMPIGIRIGNSVVFSGEIVNKSISYQYTISLANGGADYAVGDELLILAADGLTFKIRIVAIDQNGTITEFAFLGPSVGNVSIPSNPTILPAIYDPRSQLPRYGNGARFTVSQLEQPTYRWQFPANWLNKPVYCGDDANAGKPVLEKNDSFLGWVTSTNSIRLALDLRNEASQEVYGTTRYATNEEVKEVVTHVNASEQTAVMPSTLKANYLQTSLPLNQNQTGSSLANPINVKSYVRFDKVVLGKNTVAPYNSTSKNPYVTDDDISFYGMAFRAWWADLAEFYEADQFYEPGTLITMGKGLKEISIATDECNGIISTNPGYQLGEKKSDLHLPVALVGRVPVLFDGHCMPKFGDRIYLSKIKKGCASTVENGRCLGKIIAKSFGTSKLIECAVRIDF